MHYHETSLQKIEGAMELFAYAKRDANARADHFIGAAVDSNPAGQTRDCFEWALEDEIPMRGAKFRLPPIEEFLRANATAQAPDCRKSHRAQRCRLTTGNGVTRIIALCNFYKLQESRCIVCCC